METFSNEPDATAGSRRKCCFRQGSIAPGTGDHPLAETWASGITVPTYAVNDQTTITVVDGVVEGVSEGQWKRLK